jgi:hypothetical protein
VRAIRGDAVAPLAIRLRLSKVWATSAIAPPRSRRTGKRTFNGT